MSVELMRDRLHWLARAAESYALAEALHDREAKQVMFEIALMYEQIAVRSEQFVAAEAAQRALPWRRAS
jgi:hypothetical protein